MRCLSIVLLLAFYPLRPFVAELPAQDEPPESIARQQFNQVFVFHLQAKWNSTRDIEQSFGGADVSTVDLLRIDRCYLLGIRRGSVLVLDNS